MNIGFLGGSGVRVVGEEENFLMFFSSIKNWIDWDLMPNHNCQNLICDRLYKRYVRMQDLDLTTDAMNFIFEQFQRIVTDTNEILANRLSNILESYLKCVENIKFIQKQRETKNVLRIIVAELPHCVIDTERSLEKLDAWDGPPFWTRFYLKELYDQGKEIPELPF